MGWRVLKFAVLSSCFHFVGSEEKVSRALLVGRHKEGRSRRTGHDPTSLEHRKGEGQIAVDVVLNIGI